MALKKIGLVVLSLLLLLCMTACEPQMNKIVYQSDKTDRQELASGIFSNYLKAYEKSFVSSKCKLKDFSVESISGIKDIDGGFLFWVSFSLKPYSGDDSDWVAGNGRTEGSWIKNKLLYVKVKQEGEKYTITEMGTGL